MYDKPKGKRRDRQPLPWWALALILLLGAGVLLWAVAANTPSGVSDSLVAVDDESLYATATYMIEQATATAQAVNAELALTQSAPGGTQNESVNQESLYLTATYMIVQATQMAMTPQPGS